MDGASDTTAGSFRNVASLASEGGGGAGWGVPWEHDESELGRSAAARSLARSLGPLAGRSQDMLARRTPQLEDPVNQSAGVEYAQIVRRRHTAAWEPEPRGAGSGSERYAGPQI